MHACSKVVVALALCALIGCFGGGGGGGAGAGVATGEGNAGGPTLEQACQSSCEAQASTHCPGTPTFGRCNSACIEIGADACVEDWIALNDCMGDAPLFCDATGNAAVSFDDCGTEIDAFSACLDDAINSTSGGTGGSGASGAGASGAGAGGAGADGAGVGGAGVGGAGAGGVGGFAGTDAAGSGGASGAGGTGATEGWFCTQTGAGCTCIPSTLAQDDCTQPKGTCCFLSHEGIEVSACQCYAESDSVCILRGMPDHEAVATCPP